MKSMIWLVLIMTTLACRSAPKPVVWGSKDINNPMRIILSGNEPIIGASGQTLIIDGYVDVTHENDVNDQQNIDTTPTRITVVFDYFRFEANSVITTKSNLVLVVNKTIGGTVTISNIRGVSGVPGSAGAPPPGKASVGKDGPGSAKGANASIGSPARHGHAGGAGGNGSNGIDGNPARHGEDGAHSGSIIFDINKVLPETLFRITTKGGNGGNGGKGGKGQDGGDGGRGGTGGAGGNSSIPGKDGGNGGSGGTGGNGGNGGKGGVGGNGGNGGDGGTVEFFSKNENTIRYLQDSLKAQKGRNDKKTIMIPFYPIQCNTLGGEGGQGGDGGEGGASGAAGPGGSGGPGGHGGPGGIFASAGKDGSSGGSGNNGQPGIQGPNGEPGVTGRNGQVFLPKVFKKTKEAAKSRDLKDYKPASKMTGNFRLN